MPLSNEHHLSNRCPHENYSKEGNRKGAKLLKIFSFLLDLQGFALHLFQRQVEICLRAKRAPNGLDGLVIFLLINSLGVVAASICLSL